MSGSTPYHFINPRCLEPGQRAFTHESRYYPGRGDACVARTAPRATTRRYGASFSERPPEDFCSPSAPAAFVCRPPRVDPSNLSQMHRQVLAAVVTRDPFAEGQIRIDLPIDIHTAQPGLPGYGILSS